MALLRIWPGCSKWGGPSKSQCHPWNHYYLAGSFALGKRVSRVDGPNKIHTFHLPLKWSKPKKYRKFYRYLPHSFQGSFLSGNHQKPRDTACVLEERWLKRMGSHPLEKLRNSGSKRTRARKSPEARKNRTPRRWVLCHRPASASASLAS